MKPRTLLDRLWDQHLVCQQTPEAPAILFVDLHLLNEVTSPQAFEILSHRGLTVRNPERTLAVIDHATPTLLPDADGKRPYVSAAAEAQVVRRSNLPVANLGQLLAAPSV